MRMREHILKLGKILIGLGIALLPGAAHAASSAESVRSYLSIRLDERGPYLFLVSERAEREYSAAIRLAQQLHPHALLCTVSPADTDRQRQILSAVRPRYVLWFVKPEELDVNFAWRWLRLVSSLDDDPFVDARSGFITGDTSQAAADLLNREAAALAGRLKLPAAFVDILGPNLELPKDAFFKSPGSFVAPALASAWPGSSISHGREGFLESRLGEAAGAGLVHIGGHGFPDRVVDCLNGPAVRRLRLSPCVFFSGACYTGVTGRWFDVSGNRVQEKQVEKRVSFGLNALANQVVAYLAALHADHGMPVYQEMEFLAYSGASLGDVWKHSQDAAFLASGRRMGDHEPLLANRTQAASPTQVMTAGTASRVLFGDPALVITSAAVIPPFALKVRTGRQSTLEVQARLQNPQLAATLTDTYHGDLSRTRQFNDRALLACPLPEGWLRVRRVEVLRVATGANGGSLPHRLVGFAVERDGGRYILWIQVDIAAEGFMSSPFRKPGATIDLKVSR